MTFLVAIAVLGFLAVVTYRKSGSTFFAKALLVLLALIAVIVVFAVMAARGNGY